MLNALCQLAKEAGEAIMTVYQGEKSFSVQYKPDDSPLTQADLLANEIICDGLTQLSTDIPILSEESLTEWQQRKLWQRYWLVDPLDGTREFLCRNGEFTVNIALIEQGKPVLGVVYAPALAIMYAADRRGAWKEEGGKVIPIFARSAVIPKVVISRHYQRDPQLQAYLRRLGQHEVLPVGSSLKFCLVAEGQAQLYPRFGPTNIWDTAAGQAIAEAAGATVTDWQGNRLDYTPAPVYLNPAFLVSVIK